MPSPNQNPLGESPFPGIDAYSYAYRTVFYGREAEAQTLIRLVVMYRAVLLYADSGTGKSSLLNAGLIPIASENGYLPHRVRVQPKVGQEIVVERIPNDDLVSQNFLPSLFDSESTDSCGPRIVLSIAEFADLIHKSQAHPSPLLIFDQFEEWFTLFEEGFKGPNKEELKISQRGIFNLIISLITDSRLPVKVLISFREDYLAKLAPFFERLPSLPDQYLRLEPIRGDRIASLIRAPFETRPKQYDPEIESLLAEKIQKQFLERNQNESTSLTEVQIVCRDLMKSGENTTALDSYFDQKGGVQGILESYSTNALRSLDAKHQDAAVRLLTRMITSAGTRKVIEEEDLLHRVESEDSISKELLVLSLKSLERDAKLVQLEQRRDANYYEIASEFLVPWIVKKSQEQRLQAAENKIAAELEKQRSRFWMNIVKITAVVSVLLAVIGLMYSLELTKLNKKNVDIANKLEQRNKEIDALRLTQAAFETAHADPELGANLALQAGSEYDSQDPDSARNMVEAFNDVLQQTRPELTIVASAGRIVAVAYNSDGQSAYSADEEGRVSKWDLAKGRQIATAPTPAGKTSLAAWNSKYALWALASQGGGVTLWSPEARKTIPTKIEKNDVATALGFSPGGAFLAVAIQVSQPNVGAASDSQDETIVKLFKLDSKESTQELNQVRIEGKVVSLSFDKNEQLLALASSGGESNDFIEVRDLPSMSVVHRWESSESIRVLAFNPTDSGLVVVAAGDTANVLDITAEPPRVISSGKNNLSLVALAFDASGKRLATVGSNNVVKIWNVESKNRVAAAGKEELQDLTELLMLRGHSDDVNSLQFSPDAGHLITGSDDKSIKLWNLKVEPRTFSIHSIGPKLGEAMSPDGHWYAAAYPLSSTTVLNLQRNEQAQIEPLAIQELTKLLKNSDSSRYKELDVAVAFGPGTNRLAILGGILEHGSDKTRTKFQSFAEIVDLASHKLIYKPLFFTSPFKLERKIALSPGGRLIAITGLVNYNAAQIWDASSRKKYLPLRGQGHLDVILDVQFSPDGSILATASADHTVKLWDVASGYLLKTLTGSTDAVRCLSFSPDGHLLATAGSDRKISIWDITSLENSHEIFTPLVGHFQPIDRISFSPDKNRHLLSSVSQEAAKVWDYDKFQELLSFEVHGEVVTDAAFDPSASNLFVSVGRNSVAKYSLDLKDVVNSLYVSRPFTQEECNKYRLGNVNSCKATDLVEKAETSASVNLDLARAQLEEAAKLEPRLNIEVSKAAGWAAEALVIAGTKDAEEGKQDSARQEFETAWKLDPDIKPKKDMNLYIAELRARSLAERGVQYSREGRIDAATKAFEDAAHADPKQQKESPNSLSRAIFAKDLLLQAQNLLAGENDNIEYTIKLYKQASNVLGSEKAVSAGDWNALCWRGTVKGHAADVITYCDLAVELANQENEKWNFRDSRGVARAVLGRYEEAAQDFDAFIVASPNPQWKTLRLHYVQMLRRKKPMNPFTALELKKLAGE